MNPECPITLRAIVHHVARSRGIPERHLYGRSRKREICDARLLVYWLARELPGMSSAVAGRLLGDREHSTILQGAKALEEKRATDPALAAELDSMKASLLGSVRTGLLADPDPSAVAARIASAVDPIREGLRASAMEVAGMAARLADLEELAAACAHLLARSNHAKTLDGDDAREFAAGTRALIEAIADELDALGFPVTDEPSPAQGELQ